MSSLKASLWLKDIACKDESPKLFSSFDPEQISQAKAICGTCPVRKQCFAAYHNTSLIAGGTTKYERLLQAWHRVEDIDDSNW